MPNLTSNAQYMQILKHVARAAIERLPGPCQQQQRIVGGHEAQGLVENIQWSAHQRNTTGCKANWSVVFRLRPIAQSCHRLIQ